MINLPTAAQLHFAQSSRRITVGGVIYKNDGTSLRCTIFDDDLVIDGGDLDGFYASVNAISPTDMQSQSDLSVDNLEVGGAFGLSFGGFNAQDIEAGLYDDAPFEMFLCQWDNPSAWQKVARRGYLGQITRTSEGTFQAEWRGLTQLLSQNIGQSYDETCNVVRFGDSRCTLNTALLQGSGTVLSVVDRRLFQTNITWPGGSTGAGYADLGELRFDSGVLVPYVSQIMHDTTNSSPWNLTLWEDLPYDVPVGALQDHSRMRQAVRDVPGKGEYGQFSRAWPVVARDPEDNPRPVTAADLACAARELLGVRFLHQGRTRSGLDCIGMLIYVAGKFALLRDMPLRADYGRMPTPELKRVISRICDPIEEPADRAPAGALVLIRFPGSPEAQHAALCTGRTLIHCSSMHGKVVEHGYRGGWHTLTDSLWWIRGVARG